MTDEEIKALVEEINNEPDHAKVVAWWKTLRSTEQERSILYERINQRLIKALLGMRRSV